MCVCEASLSAWYWDVLVMYWYVIGALMLWLWLHPWSFKEFASASLLLIQDALVASHYLPASWECAHKKISNIGTRMQPATHILHQEMSSSSSSGSQDPQSVATFMPCILQCPCLLRRRRDPQSVLDVSNITSQRCRLGRCDAVHSFL